MKDSNDFDKEELARWFEQYDACFWCQLTKKDKKEWNYGNAMHHILGRDREFNSSLLNCCFINNELCHLPNHPKLKKRHNKILLLRKTLEYLMNKGYEFTQLDINFMTVNQDLYKEIVEQKE